MCVLFLLVGSSQGAYVLNKPESSILRVPTVIASNRDEYFSRTTCIGELLCQDGRSVRRFLPTDMESGGSWLGFDLPINTAEETIGAFRFAVVLNYHEWRNTMKSARKDDCRLDSSYQTLSRGLLVKNYIIENWTSAKEYANSLVDSINKYRPFNLIIGDEAGVYYISSHHPTPRLLTEGTLYGIANGDELFEYCASSSPPLPPPPAAAAAATAAAACEENKKELVEEEEEFIIGKWQKLSRGCRLMDERVLQPFRQELLLLSSQSTSSSSSNHRTNQQQLSTVLRNAARSVCDEVLSDCTPLPDPSFGRESEAACQLGAIFVVPTIVNTPSSTLPSSSSPHDNTQAPSNRTDDEEEEERRRLILSSYRTVRQQEGNLTFSMDDLIATTKLFGTRTSTALVFFATGDQDASFALADRNFDSSTKQWTSRDIFL